MDAAAVHGDVYDYAETAYVRSHDKVKVICRAHGPFLVKAYSHLDGKGCRQCGIARRSAAQARSTEEFVREAQALHGTRYGYAHAWYLNNSTHVRILCETHGVFPQAPYEHLNGAGCPKCSYSERGRRRATGLDKFVRSAQAVHGERYGYAHTEYSRCDDPVSITCREHGEFWRSPGHHLAGHGCHECTDGRDVGGFKPHRPSAVYILVAREGGLAKIGITGGTQRRFRRLTTATPFVFEVAKVYPVEGKDARRIEAGLLSLAPSAGFAGFDGATEWVHTDQEILTRIYRRAGDTYGLHPVYDRSDCGRSSADRRA